MPTADRDIVVVDDNPVLTDVVSEILSDQGWTVRTAADGFAALAIFRQRVPDVLLSDLVMAGMSGFELLSVVRNRFPAVACIAMSGAYSGNAVPAGIAADAFYAKGCSSVARLIDLLGGLKGQRRELPRRVTTPVWVSPFMACSADALSVLVSCPECLRVFACAVANIGEVQSARCSHCDHCFPLAFVRGTRSIDHTLPSGVSKVQPDQSTPPVSSL